MPDEIKSTARIPVICVDHSTAECANIFNPNSWEGPSKSVILSAWTEYSVLRHCMHQIRAIVLGAEGLCANSISDLNDQWRRAKFPLNDMVFFAQHADLHIRIEAFFSGAKSLLDLVVQVLCTEGIIGVSMDGFHRSGPKCEPVYGGRVLSALGNNAVAGRGDVAESARQLILEHKNRWIDQTIAARDLLVHPDRGMHQLMFNLELVDHDGTLVCQGINPPHIGDVPIHEYAEQTFACATEFSTAFLALVQVRARV